MYLAIVRATHEGRVAKYAEFATEAEAAAHVAGFGGFVAQRPDAPWPHWVIDMAAQSISVSAPPAPPRRYAKAALFRAMTDAEVGTWEQIEPSFSARHVRIFNGATILDGSDDLFPVLRGAMVDAYGEARTSEILAAAEV